MKGIYNDKNKYHTFRQNYEGNISNKLEINKEDFYSDNYETKQPIGLAIFGFFMFLYGIFAIFKITYSTDF